MINQLLALQRRQRDAHLSGDAEAMVALFAEDFMSIQDGEVSRPNRDASRARFERYFALVTFIAWEDLAPPVVEVSRDGTLATVLVQKRVHVTYADDGGVRQEEVTIFAWVETWRHRLDRWELAMVVSTRKSAD